MKYPTYHIYLTDTEYSKVIHSLVDMKNKLMQEGKYTDVIDDILIRFSIAKKKNIRVVIK
jgi:hypothetical protein